VSILDQKYHQSPTVSPVVLNPLIQDYGGEEPMFKSRNTPFAIIGFCGPHNNIMLVARFTS
jgi:hypothetical protein